MDFCPHPVKRLFRIIITYPACNTKQHNLDRIKTANASSQNFFSPKNSLPRQQLEDSSMRETKGTRDAGMVKALASHPNVAWV